MKKLLRDRSTWLTGAALALGGALYVRDGLYSPVAIALLGIAVVLGFASLAFQSRAASRWGRFITMTMIAAAVALFIAYAGYVLRTNPSPFMDVFVFQRDACGALLRGVNPYTITYPNIYAGPSSFVYDPALVHGDRLLFGFPYMPLTLWWDLIGHVAVGDYRFANLLAVAIAAVCVALIGSSKRSVLAALLLLFGSRSFYVLDKGWTEPLSVLLLAAMLLAVGRFRGAVPYLFGLMLASKQYMVLAIPLIPLLTDWRNWKFHLKAIAAAAVVTLPLGLWDVRAFWDNAVLLQFRQPFRDDAMSFAALLAHVGLPKLPAVVPLLAALATALICGKRVERSAHGFALGFALTFLTFFALSKQAFANYYFLVIAAFCCSLAAATQSGTPRRAASRLD